VPKVRGINPKQASFVREYLVDLNATQAAIRAGYSAKNAGKIGPALIGDSRIAAAVQSAMSKRAKRTEITADRVLEEIAAVAFAHMGEYAKWGGEKVTLTDSSEVDPRAVVEVKQTVNQFGNNVGIKLHDKLGALEKLGKHLGMFKDEAVAGGQPPVKAYPQEDWERLP
jgi:phage terminase small subunit